MMKNNCIEIMYELIPQKTYQILQMYTIM